MRTNVRAAAIMIADGEILLMHRRKNGVEYWVFPGGGVEEGETAEEAVLREVAEETGLTGANVRVAFKNFDQEMDQVEQPFFFVDVPHIEPILGGPEVATHSEGNWYHPEWVKLTEVEKLYLLPGTAKAKFLQVITDLHLIK